MIIIPLPNLTLHLTECSTWRGPVQLAMTLAHLDVSRLNQQRWVLSDYDMGISNGSHQIWSFQVIPLLVGFSGGQIQLIDPARYYNFLLHLFICIQNTFMDLDVWLEYIQNAHRRKELSRLYNEERLVDKSRVSCLKWVFQASSCNCQIFSCHLTAL